MLFRSDVVGNGSIYYVTIAAEDEQSLVKIFKVVVHYAVITALYAHTATSLLTFAVKFVVVNVAVVAIANADVASATLKGPMVRPGRVDACGS